MDEFTCDAFANRDHPIPVVSFEGDEDLSAEEEDVADEGIKMARIQKHGRNGRGTSKKAQQMASAKGVGVQDRLLEKYILHSPNGQRSRLKDFQAPSTSDTHRGPALLPRGSFPESRLHSKTVLLPPDHVS